jgi:hypothetical protein
MIQTYFFCSQQDKEPDVVAHNKTFEDRPSAIGCCSILFRRSSDGSPDDIPKKVCQ